jgi:hypothetical protein
MNRELGVFLVVCRRCGSNAEGGDITSELPVIRPEPEQLEFRWSHGVLDE